MKYPMSKELQSAIRLLFDDPDVAHVLLGHGLSREDREIPSTDGLDMSARVRLLRDTIEAHVAHMAAELAELGVDELPRLRSEAAGMLIALREVQTVFCDVFAVDR